MPSYGTKAYGNLTHRVNPDGTPYKEVKTKGGRTHIAMMGAGKMAGEIHALRKQLRAAKRLARSMYKADNHRAACKIYEAAMKKEGKK